MTERAGCRDQLRSAAHTRARRRRRLVAGRDAHDRAAQRGVRAAGLLDAATRRCRGFREFQPDVVLLDLMLPGKDGVDVCREIRAESGVPIVMLTAKSDTDRRRRRPRVRRRRLRREAVQAEGAGGPDPGPAPPLRGARRRSRCTIGDLVDRRRRPHGEARRRGALADPARVRPARLPGPQAVAGVHPRGAARAGVGLPPRRRHPAGQRARPAAARRRSSIDPENPEIVLTVRGVGYKAGEAVRSTPARSGSTGAGRAARSRDGVGAVNGRAATLRPESVGTTAAPSRESLRAGREADRSGAARSRPAGRDRRRCPLHGASMLVGWMLLSQVTDGLRRQQGADASVARGHGRDRADGSGRLDGAETADDFDAGTQLNQLVETLVAARRGRVTTSSWSHRSAGRRRARTRAGPGGSLTARRHRAGQRSRRSLRSEVDRTSPARLVRLHHASATTERGRADVPGAWSSASS